MSKILKPVVRIAAPVLGFLAGGPLGAAAGGALGSAVTGGGGKDIALSGLLGGAGGALAGGLGSVAGAPLAGGIGPTAGGGLLGGLTRALPSLGGAISGASSALSGATSGLSGMLGTSAGSTLTGGLQGATQGSGILGAVTRGLSSATSSLPSGLTSGVSSLTGGTGGSMLGSSLLSNILGGSIAQRSANKQRDALIDAIAQAKGEYAPYSESGLAANQKLSDLLQSGQLGTQTPAFSAEAFKEDPGYQFRLAEGEKALNRRLAAGGNYFSGDALKATQEYGQGLADQTYQDAFSRYQTEAQRKAQEEQAIYNMLYGQQGVGMNAAGNIANLNLSEGEVNAAARAAKNNALSRMLGGFV